MGIFGKLAYDEGATVGTLLAVRFALAAALFWALVLATGAARQVRALSGPRRRHRARARRRAATARRPAPTSPRCSGSTPSLLSLLLYTFPAMVTVAADRARPRAGQPPQAVALALASAGLVLVLAGAGAGRARPVGARSALTAAVVYSAYILDLGRRRRARRGRSC